MNDTKNHTQAYASYLDLRYREAYEDAKDLRKFGTFTKYLGIVCAVIVGFVIPVYFSITGVSGEFGQSSAASGALWLKYMISGAGTLIVLYIVGTAICGMSDILKVTTDTSINTSPMLSPEQKVEIVLHKVIQKESPHHKIDREINA